MFSFAAVIYFIWFLSEVILYLLTRSKDMGGNRDKKSMILIWGLLFIALALPLYLIDFENWQISSGTWLLPIGLGLLLLGILLRFVVINAQKKLFTTNRFTQHYNEFKTDGLHKYVRYPAYSASLLSFLGFGLSLNNWLALTVAVGLSFTAFAYRIHRKEKKLTDSLEVNYLIYKNTTKRLIPFLY